MMMPFEKGLLLGLLLKDTNKNNGNKGGCGCFLLVCLAAGIILSMLFQPAMWLGLLLMVVLIAIPLLIVGTLLVKILLQARKSLDRKEERERHYQLYKAYPVLKDAEIKELKGLNERYGTETVLRLIETDYQKAEMRYNRLTTQERLKYRMIFERCGERYYMNLLEKNKRKIYLMYLIRKWKGNKNGL